MNGLFQILQLSYKTDLSSFGQYGGKLGNFLFNYLVTLPAVAVDLVTKWA